MKIGVFFRGGNPPPWERDWAQYYEDTLQQVKLAEDVGFDGVTTTEHHFSPDGYFPSPLVFEAAMAARTERVDIASYLILLPFYHPLRFAEDAAMVDVLSGGRLILGLGVGYRWHEFEGFGVPREQSGEVMDECLEVVIRAFTEDNFDFEGKHFNLRDVSIRPKSYRKPRPVIWVGAPSPAGLRRVAQWELEGFCGLPSPEAYQQYLKLCERYSTKPIATAQSLIQGHYSSDSPEQAYEEARPYAQWMSSYYRRWWWNYGRSQSFGSSLQETFVFGNADTWIERLQSELNAKDPEVSYTWLGFGSNPGMPHEMVMRAIEGFGKDVLPQIAHG